MTMVAMDPIATNTVDLWRRLGLEELYEQVRKAEEATQSFAQTLKSLPKCKKCARSVLLDGLQVSGGKLSVQLISLGILSSALKDAVAAAEKASADVAQNVSTPCRCAGEPCTCHD